jgi:serine/threonine protein kinase
MAQREYGSTGGDRPVVAGGPIGGGRRYEVYRAWDPVLGRTVVLKLMRPSRLGDARSREAFEREVRIAGRFEHPNLVRLVRAHDGPQPYLVLELVDAPTLDEHLERHRAIGLPEVCVLGRRILAALAHLHAHGVAHLDVKPANITIGDPPRLLDLGSAREVPAMLGHPVGTAAYMSPEQCRGERVGTSSDLFGLGVTLYEALTGLRPFPEGDDASDDRAARFPQLVEPPQPLTDLLPEVPPQLAAIVHACIATDARDRPDAVTAAAELRRVLIEIGFAALAR